MDYGIERYLISLVAPMDRLHLSVELSVPLRCFSVSVLFGRGPPLYVLCNFGDDEAFARAVRPRISARGWRITYHTGPREHYERSYFSSDASHLGRAKVWCDKRSYSGENPTEERGIRWASFESQFATRRTPSSTLQRWNAASPWFSEAKQRN